MRLIAPFLFLGAVACNAPQTDVNPAEAETPNAGANVAFRCSGTEPFWGLSLDDNQAKLTRVGAEPEPQASVYRGGRASIDEAAGEYSGAARTGKMRSKSP